MIRKLVTHSVHTALAESKHYWLAELFEKGFAGYRNLSRTRLLQELQMRGLEGDDDPPEDDELEDIDVDDGGYDDPGVMLPLRGAQAE
jgi:hypothetical protein